ncbi:transposase [Nocardia sp. NPDC057663]|uniref:transposase n=1 Tax=Nocardia sp. NPDC057663 TaxID=3346201 RepID=UPI003672CE28
MCGCRTATASEADKHRARPSTTLVFQGILFVQFIGIGWEDLPRELGFGSGMMCWLRLRDWQPSGV